MITIVLCLATPDWGDAMNADVGGGNVNAGMNAKRWSIIFAAGAVVLFGLTLLRTFYLDFHVAYRPCDEPSLADNAVAPAASAPSVVKIFPNDQIVLGAPLCVAIAGPANIAVDKAGKPVPLHLFVDGQELIGSVGTIVSHNNLVLFYVSRTADDAAVWSKIMAQMEWGASGARIPVHIGVGTDAGEFDNPSATQLALTVVDIWALAAGALTFLAAVGALLCAARISAILRDGKVGSSYSLGRVQMAFWLYLITAAFVLIWLVTGDYNGVLTGQALTLLGISGSTGLMAIAVNNGGATTDSAGFWADILSDGGGVALHRLQIVVWTLILGVVFLAEIYRSFRLPEFDSNLLILMGISGVTYVGFKFNEKP
jgi:hypothetical protein